MQRISALLVLLVLPAWRNAVTASRLQDRRRNNRSEAETQVDADHPAAVSHRARAAHRKSLAADDGSGSLQSFAVADGTALGRQDREEGAHASSNASKPLPEHGFHGRLVAHEDGKTYTKDWRAEYGPHAKNVASYDEICAQYPHNDWCKINHPSAYSARSSGGSPGGDSPGGDSPGVDASSDGGASWGDLWPDQLGGSDSKQDGHESWRDYVPDPFGGPDSKQDKHESHGGVNQPKQGKHESHGGLPDSGARASCLVGMLGAAAALL